ncbi:MAG: ActS/PrrB/RegB family redox-sensitive histidine kinase [Pseudomonadota bacterium]
MAESLYYDMLRGGARARWVRLKTLTTLRWFAVSGQAIAVAIAVLLFDVYVPLAPCILAIAIAIVFNIVSMQVFPANQRLSERAATISMLFDLGQLSALLILVGGLTNPFAMLILAPVTISASTLTLRSAFLVALSALCLVSIMAVASAPLRFEDGELLLPPPIYIFGIWAALTISICFMTLYARRVTVETYRMTRALRAAESALAREQRLTAIGGLAAAAAHELGTPLATIKLVSSELAEELADDAELREDAELIRSQADRCRDILNDLRQGGRSDEHVRRLPISALVLEAAEPHRDRGAHIIMRYSGGPLTSVVEQPLVYRRPEIIHGLRNLIQNAVDFAETTIWIDVSETENVLRISVGDDGPGYPEDLLQRLGDPYVSSRPRAARTHGDHADGEYKGMGLGLFIAKTLLERSGARVSFATAERGVRRRNRGAPLEARSPSGAVAAAVWPVESIVVPERDERPALGDNPKFSIQNI